MELIYVKDVDKSLLYQGFTIRTALLNPFINAFGKLKIGETRYISIILGGKVYSGIKVINQNFDREKYPDHPELYQIRYDNVRDLINALRIEFADLYTFINTEMCMRKELKKRGEPITRIRIPDSLRASLAFYSTNDPNVWEAVSVTSDEYKKLNNSMLDSSIDEVSFERMLLMDDEATIVEQNYITKVRKLDRNVCLNLKEIYCYRCQVCGELISAPYGDKPVVDAHHIDFFTRSLNNNFSNVMILCPNHHRIVHTYNPVFKRNLKVWIYPNGYKEGLKLNLHL